MLIFVFDNASKVAAASSKVRIPGHVNNRSGMM
jgi:hypothetical protein